jgi:hypothetical protein
MGTHLIADRQKEIQRLLPMPFGDRAESLTAFFGIVLKQILLIQIAAGTEHEIQPGVATVPVGIERRHQLCVCIAGHATATSA